MPLNCILFTLEAFWNLALIFIYSSWIFCADLWPLLTCVLLWSVLRWKERENVLTEIVIWWSMGKGLILSIRKSFISKNYTIKVLNFKQQSNIFRKDRLFHIVNENETKQEPKQNIKAVIMQLYHNWAHKYFKDKLLLSLIHI